MRPVVGLVADIHLARGDLAIDVELSCPPGITCIMGPAGSAKSTILSVLAGLTVPDRGRVALGDEVWLDLGRGIDVPVQNRRLAFVFQKLALFPHMSGLQNVAYAMHDVPQPERN